ncbi:MAG: cysteine hydrolase [Firmicutes bacterium]|nr:cysteine hydrolase [Bacillota bacterium]
MSKEAGEVLLVIDMLNDFIDPRGALYVGDEAREVVGPIRRRVERARREGIPVIYVCDRHLESDPEFRMFPKHCVTGTWGAEVVAELAPGPEDRVIPKRRYSAFFQTDLDLTLRELGVGRLVIAGVCTNICDLYTAADARMLNYEVVVPRDCVASFDRAAHDFALSEMERTLGAKIE